MQISDNTGKAWVTAFNDQAVELLDNRTADELFQMKEEGNVSCTTLFNTTSTRHFDLCFVLLVYSSLFFGCSLQARNRV